jgi:hypothetical protein
MVPGEGKRTIAVVTACMRADGAPDFALHQVEVTQEEAENGLHYCLVERQLLAAGYEEPFVHFDDLESPAFLQPAVREHLGLAPVVTVSNDHSLTEKPTCRA